MWGFTLLAIGGLLLLIALALLISILQVSKAKKHAPHLLEPDQGVLEVRDGSENPGYYVKKVFSKSRLREISKL